MDPFIFRDREMYCEDVAIREIAGEIDTPFYLYSSSAIEEHFRAFDRAFQACPHLICFAVKANSNLAILSLLGDMGAGADIVSGGELYRVLKAGIPGGRIVYSGVGKTEKEIKEAIEAGILMFNIESLEELDAISRQARHLGRRVRVSFRINPDVDSETHPYISTGLRENKFGLPMSQALQAYIAASGREELEVLGIDFHLGSQLTQVGPIVDAIKKIRPLLQRLESSGIRLRFIDLGGGLGIRYLDESPPGPDEYARAILSELKGLSHTLILEPGRYIVGNAGILITKLVYTKQTRAKKFYVVDAAMNDFIRPSLYQAFHEILPVIETDGPIYPTDIVGPVCETGDFFARGRPMPCLNTGSLLAVMCAGAYGFTMSSNYNSRPRVAEVMVRGSQFKVVRRPETYADLIHGEEIW